MADVNPVLKAVAAANQQAQLTASAIRSDSEAIAANENSSASIQEAMGRNVALVDSTRALGVFTVEKNNLQDAINLQMNGATERKRKLASTILENEDAKTVALNAINQKESISFLDDPVGWLTAQFTINTDIDAHNAARSASNNASAQLTKLQMLTQENVRTNTALMQTTSTESIAAIAENANLQASLLANSSRRASLRGILGVTSML